MIALNIIFLVAFFIFLVMAYDRKKKRYKKNYVFLAIISLVFFFYSRLFPLFGKIGEVVSKDNPIMGFIIVASLMFILVSIFQKGKRILELEEGKVPLFFFILTLLVVFVEGFRNFFVNVIMWVGNIAMPGSEFAGIIGVIAIFSIFFIAINATNESKRYY